MSLICATRKTVGVYVLPRRCGCNAQSAQQIQMLRMLHAYIDRDTDDAKDRWVTRRYGLAHVPVLGTPILTLDYVYACVCCRCECAWHSRMIFGDEEAQIIALDRPAKAMLSPHALADDIIAKYRTAKSGAPPKKGPGGHRGGIMTKLIRMLMTGSYRSPYRFWLSSCLETFLR